MTDLWTDLLSCLDLRSSADNSSFDGTSQQLQYHRVFGGQLLGQFIRAASLTCPDKAVTSVHTVFAREGRAADPVRYHATCQHQGRSFASLTITAHQAHALLARSSVSMHAIEDVAQNIRSRESNSRCCRMLGSENGFRVDTRRWLVTELPEILRAANYAVSARGETL